MRKIFGVRGRAKTTKIVMASVCLLVFACNRAEHTINSGERSQGDLAANMQIQGKTVNANESAGKGSDGAAVRAAIADGRLEVAKVMIGDITDDSFRQFLMDQLNSAQEKDVRRRTTEDPVNTLESIITGERGLETFWIEVAMAEFLTADRKSALAWYAFRKNELGVEENDRVVLALARERLSQGSWRDAKVLLEDVVNPEVRKAISNDIGTSMESDIRMRVRSSPAEAMKNLLGGNSGFETFWIEVAMNEFMNVNPAGVEAWYGANARRMNPEQHDRVALAFARAAIGGGRKVLAVEWARQISDSDLRVVVMNEVGNCE